MSGDDQAPGRQRRDTITPIVSYPHRHRTRGQIVSAQSHLCTLEGTRVGYRLQINKRVMRLPSSLNARGTWRTPQIYRAKDLGL